MNRYQPSYPRAAFGLAAMLMTAITIGVLVVLPSRMEPDSQELGLLRSAGLAAASQCTGANRICVDLAALRQAVARSGSCS